MSYVGLLWQLMHRSNNIAYQFIVSLLVRLLASWNDRTLNCLTSPKPYCLLNQTNEPLPEHICYHNHCNIHTQMIMHAVRKLCTSTRVITRINLAGQLGKDTILYSHLH